MGVKLRKRKLQNGRESLFLDIHHDGKRWTESLGLFLIPGDPANKETLKLAETVEAQRKLDLQYAEHGFIAPYKKRINFVDYFSVHREQTPGA